MGVRGQISSNSQVPEVQCKIGFAIEVLHADRLFLIYCNQKIIMRISFPTEVLRQKNKTKNARTRTWDFMYITTTPCCRAELPTNV